MLNNLTKQIFYSFFILWPLLIQAQQRKKEPLEQVLHKMENHYHCQFTYADAVVKDILITDFPENISLKEAIRFIEKQTKLRFQFLPQNIIAIRPPFSPQIICGYILDQNSGLPVSMATINEGNNYTTTNDKGYFSLKLSNINDSLLVRHISYETLSISANHFQKQKCKNIFLAPKIEQLSVILLQNIIAKGIHKKEGGVIQIDIDKFGILPGLIEPDILQTIQALPGIQSINETVSNINIRGGTNDQNLLLWDGVRMYQSGHFFGLISAFNPMITHKVLLIENGSDVSLSDGVSGTISMQSDTIINSKYKGSAGVNFINADIFSDVPVGKKSSFQIGIRKAISNWIKTPTYKQYYKKIIQNTELSNVSSELLYSDINFDFYDVSLRYLYKISPKDFLRINFIQVSDKFIFNKEAVINFQNEAKESSLIQNNMASGIYYKRKWNSKFVSFLQVYETDYKLKAINSDLLKNQRILQENKVSESSFNLSGTYKLKPRLSFLTGYQFVENGTGNLTDIDNPIWLHFVQEVVREHSLYSQANFISSGKKISIKAGIRENYIPKFEKFILEPRLGFSYRFSRYYNLEILGEFKHQNISQIINFQNDFLGIEKRRWRLSNNKDVPVIQSKNFSVGLNFNKRGWLVSIETYVKKVKGITSQSQGFVNQYIYKKAIGSYFIKGMDFLVNKRSKYYSSWLSYTFADNRYTFPDFVEINFPNNINISHSLTWGFSYTRRSFKTSIGLNWHTGKPTTLPINGNEVVNHEINFGPANEANLASYLRMDASATYHLSLSKKWDTYIGISLWNITNKSNILNNYYYVDSNDQPIKVSQKSLGFTPNFSLRLSF